MTRQDSAAMAAARLSLHVDDSPWRMLCVRAVAGDGDGAGRGEVGGTSRRPTDEAVTPPERSWTAGCTRIAELGRLDQIQLLQDGHSVVQPDLLDDQAVDDLENRRSGEPHRLVGAGR